MLELLTETLRADCPAEWKAAFADVVRAARRYRAARRARGRGSKPEFARLGAFALLLYRVEEEHPCRESADEWLSSGWERSLLRAAREWGRLTASTPDEIDDASFIPLMLQAMRDLKRAAANCPAGVPA